MKNYTVFLPAPLSMALRHALFSKHHSFFSSAVHALFEGQLGDKSTPVFTASIVLTAGLIPLIQWPINSLTHENTYLWWICNRTQCTQ